MICDDQAQVTAFLSNPATHAGAPVEVIETHISRVFLAGNRVYKLKRAVNLPYADFSTPRIRLRTCEKELALNRPHAPGLYLSVRRITRTPGGALRFGGDGPLVDAVVEMARFDQDALFDRMAERGALTPALMTDLAGSIAEFHAAAPVSRDGTGAQNLAAVLDINRAGFATSSVFASAEIDALDAAFRRALETHAAALNRRAAAGRIRRCHGDLHLRNICLFGGRPTLFDCIEFNDAIATCDTLYDLAFLLMDLWARDLAPLANLVANRYFDATGADEGFALLPFLMAIRAAVRAHVTATHAETGGDAADIAAARRYFDLAAALLAPALARIVAIGGFSGTGKTTVAEALAPHLGAPPGARVIESDRTRKALFAQPAESRLPQTAYAPEVSDRVYTRLADRALAVSGAGAAVVVDAVFASPRRRAALQAALAAGPAPFDAFWLHADPQLLRDRVAARRGGPSDATVDILEAQLARDPGPIRWTRIAVDRPVGRITADIRARLTG